LTVFTDWIDEVSGLAIVPGSFFFDGLLAGRVERPPCGVLASDRRSPIHHVM